MPDIVFTENEWKALLDEPEIALKIYLAISRRRDFSTNIAGEKTHINEQYFREILNYPSIPGRKKSQPITQSKIRYWLDRLEKIGLIIPRGNFIFECPLAAQPNLKQNKYDVITALTTTQGATQGTTQKNSKNPNKKRNNLKEEQREEDCKANASYLERHSAPLYICNNNTTSPLYTRARSSEQPETVGRWEEILVNDCGFKIHQVKRAEVIQMLVEWCKHNVTCEEAFRAMACADDKLGRRPDTPKFYKNFIEDEVNARRKAYEMNFKRQGKSYERKAIRRKYTKQRDPTRADVTWKHILENYETKSTEEQSIDIANQQD